TTRCGWRVGRLVLHARDPNLMTDSIALRPKLPRHGLVDDYQRRTPCGFRAVPQAALSQGNAQYREIVRADEVDPHDGFFGFGSPYYLYFASPAIRGRCRIGRDTRGDHLRHGGNSGANLFEVLGPLLPGLIGILVDGDRQGHGVMRIVAEIRI